MVCPCFLLKDIEKEKDGGLKKEEMDILKQSNENNEQAIFDLKNAKRFCNKEQKVIKVPNPNVFKIVAPLLLNKGISRIVSADKLIAL